MRRAGIYDAPARGQVGAVGEARLIALIRRWLGDATPAAPHGIGDDCALLPRPRGRALLTVDPVIHGVHFDNRVTPAQAGAKLMRRNLSDIAAMGGRPTAAVVALALDPRVSLSWLASFYRSIAREGRRHRVALVGGDVARAPGVFVATLALLGEAGARTLTRAGARLGDWVYVTGRLGGSLRSGHHHAFRPRLAEGAWLAGRQEVRSMMDLSDGLAKDLPALAPRSAQAALFAAALPLSRGAGVRQALCDGEDYELVVSVAKGARRDRLERAWKARFPRTPLTCIGRFVAKGRVPPDALDLDTFRGYEHLRKA